MKDLIQLRYFTKSEFHDFDKMNTDFLLYIDEVRYRYGRPFITTCDYVEKAGMHGEGKALDFHIKYTADCIIPYLAQTETLIRVCESMGTPYRIGFYPLWANPGFHVDNKKEDKISHLFWIRWEPEKYPKTDGYVYYYTIPDFTFAINQIYYRVRS
jgi:hypothetical protein